MHRAPNNSVSINHNATKNTQNISKLSIRSSRSHIILVITCAIYTDISKYYLS
jgi:hypothetical protein